MRSAVTLAFVLIAAIISVSSAASLKNIRDDALPVAVVTEDTGDLGERLLERLEKEGALQIERLTRDTAMKELRQDRLEAVFIISENYTEKLLDAQYKGIIEMYTAPSSKAAATISEPLVSNTILYWIGEEAVRCVRERLHNENKELSFEQESAMRESLMKIWDEGLPVDITQTWIEGKSQDQPFISGPAEAFVRYYGILTVFYIVVSAQWMLNIRQRSLRIRAIQRGTPLWRLFFSQGSASAAICLLGYILAGAVCLILGLRDSAKVLGLLPSMTAYLFGILCLTFFVASCLRNPQSLLLLAPVITFINAILTGLLLPLPEWGSVLLFLARLLPGYYLSLSFSGPWTALPFSFLCAAFWMILGLIVQGTALKRTG
jgi:hypothetical protein